MRTLCVFGLLVGLSTARADEKEDPVVTRLKLIVKAQEDELKELKKRVEKLEEERTQLILDRELAIRDAKQARSNEKQARDIAEHYAQKQKLAELTAQLRELKGLPPLAPPPREKLVPADSPSGVVVRTGAGAVAVNIGADAGLEVGTVLVVIRTKGKSETYLGTVKGVRVDRKMAVGDFAPASGVQVSELKSEELPDVGDTVRPQAPAPRK